MHSQPGLNLKYSKWIVHLHSSPCAVTTLADAACLALPRICTSPVMLPKTPKEGRAAEVRIALLCPVRGTIPYFKCHFFLFPSVGDEKCTALFTEGCRAIDLQEKCWELTVFLSLLFRVQTTIDAAPVFHQFESRVGLFQERMCSDSGSCSVTCVHQAVAMCPTHVCPCLLWRSRVGSCAP